MLTRAANAAQPSASMRAKSMRAPEKLELSEPRTACGGTPVIDTPANKAHNALGPYSAMSSCPEAKCPARCAYTPAPSRPEPGKTPTTAFTGPTDALKVAFMFAPGSSSDTDKMLYAPPSTRPHAYPDLLLNPASNTFVTSGFSLPAADGRTKPTAHSTGPLSPVATHSRASTPPTNASPAASNFLASPSSATRNTTGSSPAAQVPVDSNCARTSASENVSRRTSCFMHPISLAHLLVCSLLSARECSFFIEAFKSSTRVARPPCVNPRNMVYAAWVAS